MAHRGRAKSVFDPGYPTKVLLYTLGRGRLQSALTLRGWSCPGGKPLRFWYRGSRPFTHLLVSTSELERTGDLVQRAATANGAATSVHEGGALEEDHRFAARPPARQRRRRSRRMRD